MVTFLASPVVGGVKTARYGESGKWWASGNHTGLDFAAVYGSPIRALADGRVTFAGWLNGAYGNAVKIAHSGGIETMYAHMSRTAVRVGNILKQGEVIGYIGTTGNVTGPHVHVEVRVNGALRDPETVLGKSVGDAGTDPGTLAPDGGAGTGLDVSALRVGAVRVGQFVGGAVLILLSVYSARKSGVL
jgi:murein DD-endopeptidase MepM/ murein hydrolase activator NlpD